MFVGNGIGEKVFIRIQLLHRAGCHKTIHTSTSSANKPCRFPRVTDNGVLVTYLAENEEAS